MPPSVRVEMREFLNRKGSLEIFVTASIPRLVLLNKKLATHAFELILHFISVNFAT